MDIRSILDKKLGFGAMRLPGAAQGNIDYDAVCKLFDRYMQLGFNYFDTAYVYNGSEAAIKHCLTSRYSRDSYFLTDKIPTWGRDTWEEYEEAFLTMLDRCGTQYFDLVLLHNMGKPTYPRVKKADGFGYLRKIKEEGRAKFVGFSFHDTPEYLDMILTEHPFVDVVQLQINYVDWLSPAVQAKACYEVAQKHGKPVIVMEPIKGGGLANPPQRGLDEFKKLSETASPASYAIRYAASLEDVVMVLSGMNELEQVEDNASYMADFVPVNQEELEAIERVRRIFEEQASIGCTNCRYCVEGCPMEIDIPKLFSVYNAVKQYGMQNFPAMMFDRAVGGKGKPSDCIGCGACEEKCPQHLPIRELLEKVKDTFEKK